MTLLLVAPRSLNWKRRHLFKILIQLWRLRREAWIVVLCWHMERPENRFLEAVVTGLSANRAASGKMKAVVKVSLGATGQQSNTLYVPSLSPESCLKGSFPYPRCCTRQPFAVLERAPSMPCSRTEPELRMDIPGLLDDYYLNLLAWSEKNLVALALGPAVFVWNAETQVLLGSLRVRPHSCSVGSTVPSSYSPISSVSWNRDGHTLAVGTGDGEVQLWDMERRCSVRNISGHLSSVSCLSWNQQILSSGSILGLVCHHDVRATQRAVGWLRQRKGVCGLEWSPTGDRLATGSSDGLLSVWTGDPGTRGRNLPLLSLPHPTAVKALGWCPWQPELVAVGGGKGDGVLRIWDTRTGTCRQAAQTNSQICCLSWSPKKAELFTGHGLPYNQIVSWNFPTLTKGAELHGHQGRVLQLASSPCGNRVLSTGSDHLAFMWRAVDRATGRDLRDLTLS